MLRASLPASLLLALLPSLPGSRPTDTPAAPAPPPPAPWQARFEENRGQFPPWVPFLARARGFTAAL
ncbi:MAG: hypothetical protein HUU06_09125, partial [Planctomycetaceae bacterium]|nr:hypothetical protein [Planctomycetaceae bacterium]